MPCVGRGRHYGPVRPVVEGLAHRIYRGGWAVALLRALGGQRRVDLLAHRIPATSWPRGVRSLRVAFGSDFHAGPTTHPKLLELACRRLTEARPDVLLLGGDFVYLWARFVEPLAELLGRVPAPLGRFAVLGNHDLWADDRHIVTVLERHGIRVLVNANVALEAPFDHVSVCGLDEIWTGDVDVAATFAGARDVRIVLSHSPSGLVALDGVRFDLALSGHTHGGHLALPGGRAIYLPHGPLSRAYPYGHHHIGRAGHGSIVVSRGIGGVEVPFRTFAPRDVLACELGDLGDLGEAA